MSSKRTDTEFQEDTSTELERPAKRLRTTEVDDEEDEDIADVPLEDVRASDLYLDTVGKTVVH